MKINNSSEIGQMTPSIDSSLVSMTTGYSSSPASITTGNSNSSSVPMSSANGSSSSAPTITATSTESVQLLLSSFVGIFAVSLIFLMTFCICKAIKRRRGSTTVHEQQKRRNGSQNSNIHFIRSQDIELKSSQARSTEFVNVLENMNIPKNNSQEGLVGENNTQNLTYEPEVVEVVNPTYDTIPDTEEEERPSGREELDCAHGDGRQQEAKNNTASWFDSEADSKRRELLLSRRINSRSQVKSVSGLEQLTQQQDNVSSQFNRQMSVRHNNQSRAAKTKLEQFPVGQHIKSATIDMPLSVRANNFPIAAADDRDYPGGSMERNEKFSIHQVKPTNSHEDSRIEITSPYADIPSFKDPELENDGNKDVLLMLPPQPDIYSSQILSTAPDPLEEDQDNTDDAYNALARPMLHELKQRDSSLDRIISVEPPPTNDSDEEDPIGPDPRYSHLIIRSRQHSVENLENVYDEPILISTPNSEKLMLATPIFDDPGYDRAFKAASIDDTTAANVPHAYHTLEPQFITRREACTMMMPPKEGGAVQEATSDSILAETDDSNGSLLPPSQLQKNTELNKSTLALLEFCEDELQNMDPDLLSHLKTEEESKANQR